MVNEHSGKARLTGRSGQGNPGTARAAPGIRALAGRGGRRRAASARPIRHAGAPFPRDGRP